MGVPQVVQQGRAGGGGHGRAHVVDVPDLIVLHPPEGHGPDADPLPGGAQQTGPGGGGRPLGGRGADGSIAQRGAELAFSGAEMAGCHGQQAVSQPGRAERSPKPQRFGHGAAGPEQPRIGDAQRPHGVIGGRALGLQVSGQSQTDLFLSGLCFFQAEPRRPQLQLGLGGFPAGLAEPVVGAQCIEARRKGAFPLFFAAHRRMGRDDGRSLEDQGVAAPGRHEKFLLSGMFFCGFCGILENRRECAIFAPGKAYGK